MAMPHKVLDAPHPHYMNKQRGRHMEAGAEGKSQDVSQSSGQHHPPTLHFESAGNKMRATITHGDGNVTTTDHEFGDVDGMKAHIDKHYGSGFQGQGHGIKQEGADEKELETAF